ncbi:uncharacterized protein C8R40DRAFT_1065894 [Lentinula edodes]|uniref:uncharacterized protein n=1 Tax=Lentinula edodes TaxID=5353 RepID=UPI001E8CBBD3|nr:uncharacterized protein C8R40DRAFT_1065894 [Lentinula edodes]KAH7879665.1 hypothetical protein C8R40DRAFT_1065894 [Lentinula edodes]
MYKLGLEFNAGCIERAKTGCFESEALPEPNEALVTVCVEDFMTSTIHPVKRDTGYSVNHDYSANLVKEFYTSLGLGNGWNVLGGGLACSTMTSSSDEGMGWDMNANCARPFLRSELGMLLSRAPGVEWEVLRLKCYSTERRFSVKERRIGKVIDSDVDYIMNAVGMKDNLVYRRWSEVREMVNR